MHFLVVLVRNVITAFTISTSLMFSILDSSHLRV